MRPDTAKPHRAAWTSARQRPPRTKARVSTSSTARRSIRRARDSTASSVARRRGDVSNSVPGPVGRRGSARSTAASKAARASAGGTSRARAGGSEPQRQRRRRAAPPASEARRAAAELARTDRQQLDPRERRRADEFRPVQRGRAHRRARVREQLEASRSCVPASLPRPHATAAGVHRLHSGAASPGRGFSDPRATPVGRGSASTRGAARPSSSLIAAQATAYGGGREPERAPKA